jgi:cytochrome bd-type quinol oxidase subunit 2
MEKKNDSNKIGGINIIIVGVISFLYILLITKFAEIISSQYSVSNEYGEIENNDEKLGTYVMIIYFISIIGIIIGYVWLSNNNTNSQTPNWIIRWSLSIGGVIMLIYTIINYWEYLNDYCKLLLIFLSITSIIYYLYKYY